MHTVGLTIDGTTIYEISNIRYDTINIKLCDMIKNEMTL